MKTPYGNAYGYVNNSYLVKGRVPRFSRTIKNLLFTGAYAFPGGGFTGALISGYMTALNVIEPMWRFIFRKVSYITVLWVVLLTSPKWIPALISLFK